MARWLLVATVVGALVAGACSDGDNKQPGATVTATAEATSPATAGPSKPRLNACPTDADQAICDFAAAAEGWAQAGDIEKLIGGGPLDTPATRDDLRQLLETQLPGTADAPRKLRSIACPVGRKDDAPQPECAHRFALVFATVTERAPLPDGKGLLVLGYDRTPAGAQLYGYGVPEPVWQLALLAGPMTGGERLPGTTGQGYGFRIYPVEVLRPGEEPAPAPGSVETIAGIEVRELTLGPSTSLPNDVVVYVGPAAWAADSYPVLLWRVYRDPDGVLRRDDLFANARSQLGDLAIVDWAADERMGEIVFVACPAGRCRGTGVGGWAGEFDVYRSTDGGISWVTFGTVPAMTFPAAVIPEGVVMSEFQGRDDDERPVQRYFVHPSGAELKPPAPNTEPRLVPGLGIVWEPTYMDRKFGAEPVYDASGKVLDAAAFAPNLEARLMARAGDGSLYGAWQYVLDRPADPHPPSAYVGRVDGSGKPVSLYLNRVVVPWFGPYYAGPGLVIGNAELKAPAGSARPFDVPAVLIDLGTGSAAPLRELDQFIEGYEQPIVRATVVAKVARVATGQDCLNVREAASRSAPSIACYRDGVLLFERGEAVIAEGMTWVPVTTPEGKDGWASGEFLEWR